MSYALNRHLKAEALAVLLVGVFSNAVDLAFGLCHHLVSVSALCAECGEREALLVARIVCASTLKCARLALGRLTHNAPRAKVVSDSRDLFDVGFSASALVKNLTLCLAARLKRYRLFIQMLGVIMSFWQ